MSVVLSNCGNSFSYGPVKPPEIKTFNRVPAGMGLMGDAVTLMKEWGGTVLRLPRHGILATHHHQLATRQPGVG